MLNSDLLKARIKLFCIAWLLEDTQQFSGIKQNKTMAV